jgi:1,2-diacylglycerol 3-beta-glucosyltransferase
MKINKLWQGNNRDRFLLFGIIFGIWGLITLLEELIPERILDRLPSNVALSLAGAVILIGIVHQIYIFLAQFQHRRNPAPFYPDYNPSVDIFISLHNEEKVIKSTLEQLLNLNYSDYTIYVINDRSTDATLEVIEQVAAKANQGLSPKDYKIVVIDRPLSSFPGKSAALNTAFAVSNGEIICVFDADARVEADFLNRTVPYLNDPLIAAVQVQKIISNADYNYLTRLQSYEYAMDTYLQMGRDSIRGSVELRGNGQLVKRKAIGHVGGWNEETITDDLDLSTSLHVSGWDIRFSAENAVYEEGVPTLSALIKQRRRWAEGSMRRYLNYFLQILIPGNLTLHQIFDTLAFIGEFAIPLWLGLDIIYEFIRYFNGKETYISFLMLVCVGASSILFVSQFNGLRIYKQQKFLDAVLNTVITNIYVWSLWLYVIMLSYRKILFSRSVGAWVRTEHGVYQQN